MESCDEQGAENPDVNLWGQKGRGDSIRDGYLSTGIDRRKEHKAERGREGQTKDTRKTEAVMVHGPE